MKSRDAHLFVSGLLLLGASLPTVCAASRQPTVSVIAPSPSGELTVGQPFRVAAEAQADAGRRVVKVEFFVWSSNLRVGGATSAPWTAEVRPRDIFARAREERLISRHRPGSGHEGIPCLAELPNGDLLCVFYSGKYELSDDSAVYLSRLPRGARERRTGRTVASESRRLTGSK